MNTDERSLAFEIAAVSHGHAAPTSGLANRLMPWLAAHDAALLEAQSTELALCKTRARWVQVVVAELNADLDVAEAERDAALATIAEARNCPSNLT